MKRFLLFYSAAQAVLFSAPLFSQDAGLENVSGIAELTQLIGISLHDVLGRFGAPDAVYPVRGEASWQDDVVFSYKDADFYFVKDRVWQVRVQNANGIKTGDAKLAVLVAHGENAVEKGNRIIVALRGYALPLEYHYYIDSRGHIQAIFLCRADF